ncbi:GIP, partial [Symbiodinium sp. CCMP2456]
VMERYCRGGDILVYPVKWARVSRRIETMLLAAAPKEVKEELSVLPDPAIQVRALTKVTKQVDLTPDDAKVMKLHAQLLSELEAMAHRGDRSKGSDKAGTKPEEKAKGRPPRHPKSSPEGAQAPPPPPPSTEAAGQGTVAGTPVTLASLSAQLDSLRAMVRLCRPQQGVKMAKQEWLKTAGGTLVVPPEMAGCRVEWSKRKGLKVTHPTLGVLSTGVGRNTCPYLQEQQALQLIAELEASRLDSFRQQVQNLECSLEVIQTSPNPTEALQAYATTGTRRDALCAVMAQPYLKAVPDEIRATLAEAFTVGNLDDGKAVLKGLPLKRAARRSLLASDRWIVHLCSSRPRPNEPIAEWCQGQGMSMVCVDVLEKGGKGWDLCKPNGVWKALMWAASLGKIVGVLSSPPNSQAGDKQSLALRGMFLWSLASAVRGAGIPYLAEHPGLPDHIQKDFAAWSGASDLIVTKGTMGSRYLRPTVICANLEMGFMGALSAREEEVTPPHTREWTTDFRREIVRALRGRPTTPTCTELDELISKRVHTPKDPGFSPNEDSEALARMFEAESVISSEDEEECNAEVGQALSAEVQRVGGLGREDLDRWRDHIINGHVPYRRDCKQCIEGAAVGVQHRRIRHPQSYTLSADLFGPVPSLEHGRDETCVSGKCNLRYALVGAFRLPRSAIEGNPGCDGVQDLRNPGGASDAVLADSAEDLRLEDYEPSEPPEAIEAPLSQEQKDDLEEMLRPPSADTCARGEVPFRAQAVEAAEPVSLMTPEDLPQDPEAFKELVQQLQEPVEQVVLRYVIPLKGKGGPEVTEGLQKMILAINARYPVRILHTDLGTEFITTSLSRWLAGQSIRFQHTLPTDKKGNGLAERTVGWVKSRIRTLIKSAELPIHWWPLAARWAAESHNRKILGIPPLPAFGQGVLHRVKQPPDGSRQLQNRWIETKYAAPHSSIPDGHVLITQQGNLVASKGFRADPVDPTKLESLHLPKLQELDEVEAPIHPEAHEGPLQDSGPQRRLRSKTAVKFVECDVGSDLESYACTCLVKEDYSDQALSGLVQRLPLEDSSSKVPQSYLVPENWDPGGRDNEIGKEPLSWDLDEVIPLSEKGNWQRLRDHGFQLPSEPDEEVQVKVIGAGDQGPQDSEGSGAQEEPCQGESMMDDLQPHSNTELVGWDFSNGDPGEFADGREDLAGVDMCVYLRERYAEHEFRRLTFLGIKTPVDLPYLYEEDLMEAGINPQTARRIMQGIHPPGIRLHLTRWEEAARTEVQSLESMGAIRRLRGQEARNVLRSGTIEMVPAKAVCTVKPAQPYKRKVRVVSCGNFATSTEEALLYAGGAGAESLRTLLVHAGRRGRRCFGLDVKSAFLLAPIPSYVKKRYGVRPPKLLTDLGICTADEVWLIERALYGFRESPRWWSIHRDSILSTASWETEYGRMKLRQLSSESNIWSMDLESGGCLGHLLAYVDDFLLVTEEPVAQAFLRWIRERWECTDLQTATQTTPLRFLGVDEWVREFPAQEEYEDQDLRVTKACGEDRQAGWNQGVLGRVVRSLQRA